MRALLLMGGPDYHNQPFHFAELAGVFAGEARVDLRITTDLAALNAVTLAEFDAVINGSTFVQPTPDQVGALIRSIEDGMGFLGIHGGAATFWNSAAYLEMLGSRFLRHDPYKQFEVVIDNREHPITHGVPDFLVEDELYELGGNRAGFAAFASGVIGGVPYEGAQASLGGGPLGPDINVLASAEGHPLLYVRVVGEGRVHYNALGHDEQSLKHPDVRRLYRQGLAWVAGLDDLI